MKSSGRRRGDGTYFEAYDDTNSLEGAWVDTTRDPRDLHPSDIDLRKLAAVVVYDAQEELKALTPGRRNRRSSAWRFFNCPATSTLPLWCYLIEISVEAAVREQLNDHRARPRRRRL